LCGFRCPVLIGLLVALVIYLKRKSMKEAEAMWARRVAHGGYTGPAYEDESNFHRVLDSRVSLGHEHWQSDM